MITLNVFGISLILFPSPDPSSKEAPKMRPNLQARQEKVELDKTLGKSRVVESLSAKGAGYYCEVCDCVLKDSIGYLDHINGRRRMFFQWWNVRSCHH